MKISLTWLLIIPSCIIILCSLFIPLKPTALAKTLLTQYEIELQREALEKEIDVLLKQSETLQRKEQLKELNNQMEVLKHKLFLYKNDWGNSILEAFRNYYRNGMIACGNAYIPFVILMWLTLFFFALALTPHATFLPFLVRASSLLTASFLGINVIIQWLVAWIIVPSWYTKITGLVLIPIFIISFFMCWVFFIRRFFMPWARDYSALL